MTITGDFERFQYFNFETRVLKTEDFQKTEVSTKIENAIFRTILPWQKPVLKQTEWGHAVSLTISYTAQKMKFPIKDFFSKCDQIRSFLRIWSHLLKKSLKENFIFCALLTPIPVSDWLIFCCGNLILHQEKKWK